MTKKYVCHAPYLRNHTWYDFHLWYTCKMIISPGCFFIVFKILIFWVVRGLKGQKIVQNDKNLCSTPYIIWLSFVIHKCKMISSEFFFVFSKFWYFGLLGVSEGKKWPKMTKNSVFHSFYLRNHLSYDLIYGTHV